MNKFFSSIWHRVHEPKAVSVLIFFQYGVLTIGGVYATISPPNSIEGQIGPPLMTLLTILSTFGGVVGLIASLPGIWWLERTAVSSVSLAAGLYLWIILSLHFSQTGNRLLQACFIIAFLTQQAVRWVRIRERPYRPVTY